MHSFEPTWSDYLAPLKILNSRNNLPLTSRQYSNLTRAIFSHFLACFSVVWRGISVTANTHMIHLLTRFEITISLLFSLFLTFKNHSLIQLFQIFTYSFS